MKVNLNKIKEILLAQKNFLKSSFNVRKLGVFGSVVRAENTKDSDVDILVELSKPIGMFKFIELEEYLTNLIGIKVDLVTKKALKPSLKNTILQEVAYV